MYRLADSIIKLFVAGRLGRQFPGKLSTRSSKLTGDARSGIVAGTFNINNLLSRSSPLCRVIARLSFLLISSSTNISFSNAQSIVLRRFTRDRDILELTPAFMTTVGDGGCCTSGFDFLSQSRFLFFIRVLGGVLPYASYFDRRSSVDPSGGNWTAIKFLLCWALAPAVLLFISCGPVGVFGRNSTLKKRRTKVGLL